MPMPSNEGRRNLLSNERLDTFWDTLWLELWPFLYADAFKRSAAQFATELTDRQLLGHPVARAAAVFVFYCRIS